MPLLHSTMPFAHQWKGTAPGRMSIDQGHHSLRARSVMSSSSLYTPAHPPPGSATRDTRLSVGDVRRSAESAPLGTAFQHRSTLRSTDASSLPALLERHSELHHCEAQDSSQCLARSSMQCPQPLSSIKTKASAHSHADVLKDVSLPAHVHAPPQAHADVQPLQGQSMDFADGSSGVRVMVSKLPCIFTLLSQIFMLCIVQCLVFALFFGEGSSLQLGGSQCASLCVFSLIRPFLCCCCLHKHMNQQFSPLVLHLFLL